MKVLVAAFVSSLFWLVLGGCGTQSDVGSGPVEVPLGQIAGIVHGGQNPVSNSRVYVYAMGTGGDGAASVSLLTAASNTTSDGTNYYVLTNSQGEFGITGDYTCTQGQHVYIYSAGGNSGGPAGPGGLNSQIGLLGYLGTCPASGTLAGTVPYVVVNEVSTVVAAWALSAFAASPTSIASGSTVASLNGASHAAGNIANVMSIGSGAAYTFTVAAPGTSTVPMSKINTLADIMGACVNTVSSAGSPSLACSTLFSNARSVAGVTPGDTAQAMINLAHEQAPASAILSALFGLITPYGPFVPSLPSPPKDLALPIDYTTAIASAPAGMALDSQGNVWIVGSGAGAAFYSFSPQGVATAKAAHSGTATASTLAVSPLDDGIWIADKTGNVVDAYDSSGAWVGSATFTGMTQPTSMAFDREGNFFVTVTVAGLKSVAHFTSTRTYLGSLSDNTVQSSYVVLDSNATVWISGGPSGAGLLYSPVPYASTTDTSSGSIAVVATSSGMIWYLSNGGQNLTRRNTAGDIATCSNIMGFEQGTSLAIDGNGTLWTGNLVDEAATSSQPQTVAGVSPSCVPQQTWDAIDNGRDGTFEAPFFVALDAAGSLWSFNASVPSSGLPTTSLSQFLGLVASTATPISPPTIGVALF